MSELSKKARNRTRVQMVLTMLVIVSIIRQFFLGNYHNMFLGILTLILFMVPQFIDRKLGVTIPVGLETVILIFIFSAEILGEINAFYVKDSGMGYYFAYNEWIPDGGNRVCAD